MVAGCTMPGRSRSHRRHREGTGVGVAVGVTDTRLPMIAPLAGEENAPSMRRLFEQAQAATARATIKEKMAILETNSNVIEQFRMTAKFNRSGSHAHSCGAFPQSGMLPCLRGGFFSRLFTSAFRAPITLGRVSRGIITSSM
jgi:hypothetical protein